MSLCESIGNTDLDFTLSVDTPGHYNRGRGDRYGSEDFVAGSGSSRERKKVCINPNFSMRNQRQSRVPLRFEDNVNNINNSKTNKKKIGSKNKSPKKKKHEIYKEYNEGDGESRLSKGAKREDRVEINNTKGNVGRVFGTAVKEVYSDTEFDCNISKTPIHENKGTNTSNSFNERYNMRRMWRKIWYCRSGKMVAICSNSRMRQKVEPRKMPVWVKINNVPLEAWCVKGISSLASGLGEPMLIDTMTPNICHKGNLGYARVLVEMDTAKELKTEIEIQCMKGDVEMNDKPGTNADEKVNENNGKGKGIQQERSANAMEQGKWKTYKNKNNMNGEYKKRQNVEENNVNNKDNSNQWKVGDEVVKEIRNYANKYFVLDSLLEDREIEDVLKLNEGPKRWVNTSEKKNEVLNLIRSEYIKCFYTFVYAANDRIDRRKLWEELTKDSRYVSGNPWCIAGDMNVTLYSNEHLCESSIMSTNMMDFQECLKKIEVVDIVAEFFKKAWSIFGKDVCKTVKEFFNSGRMLGELNATLISLVPKVQTPNKVTDFRHIACCNVLYKCISKVITNRIKHVFGLLVSSNQSAFIFERNIQDNILLTQELMKGYNRKVGPKRIALKIDLKKAYDIIMECITTVGFTLNVNGERIGYFKGRGGLRQVMCHGDVTSIWVIKKALDEFRDCSGLLPNNSKSTIFFSSLNDEEKQAILNVLPFGDAKLPVKYLGVPLIAKRLSMKDCGRLIDKIKKEPGEEPIEEEPLKELKEEA
ncbi:RNA-directed DNA polymerase, eukaryota, reverse transcriptase zinc-binding domain protein [Tanacetum coccineum]